MDHENSCSTIIWDCNSALYDSFELNTFKRQLDSAIAARCISMPRLDEPPLAAAAAKAAQRGRKKQLSRLYKSLQKLLQQVFRTSKQREAAARLELAHGYGSDESEVYSAYPVRWSGGGLASIPEGMESPEIDYSAVRRAVSERFTSSTGAMLRIPAT